MSTKEPENTTNSITYYIYNIYVYIFSPITIIIVYNVSVIINVLRYKSD